VPFFLVKTSFEALRGKNHLVFASRYLSYINGIGILFE